jgi:WD40 repeat protein
VVGKDVLLWNAADGKETGKLTQSADVLSLSLSADKTRVLIGRADNLASLIEVATGAVVQTYPHTGPVRGVLVHPGLPQVVTASADKTVVVSPIAVQRITPLGGKVAGIAISPGLDRLVTFGPGKECVSWLAGNGQKEKAFATDGEATTAAFSKDGQKLAVSGTEGSVKLYTIADGKLIGSFAAGGPVSELAFHPTAPQLVGLVKNQATVWNVGFQAGQPLPPEFGKSIQAFPHPKGASSPIFSADGQFFTAGEDKLVRRFRIASDVPVKNLQHPNLVDCAAFDDTGNLVATGCHDGILRIWDVVKNAPIKTINAHVMTTPQPAQNPIYAVVWTPDYKQVFSSSYDHSIKLWDVASGNMVREFKAAPDPKPEEKKDDKKDEKKDAKKDDKKDDKKDTKTDEKKEPPKKEPPGPPGHRDAVFVMALSKDGKFLASGSSDKSVKLWEVATGKVVRDFPNADLKPVFPDEPAPTHPGWIHGVRFTPDGQFLVTAGAAPRYKSYIAVWNVADGKRVFGAEQDFGPIHSLAITNDGTRLILGCEAPRGRPEPDAIVIKFPGK